LRDDDADKDDEDAEVVGISANILSEKCALKYLKYIYITFLCSYYARPKEESVCGEMRIFSLFFFCGCPVVSRLNCFRVAQKI